jgi:hypothetical protein
MPPTSEDIWSQLIPSSGGKVATPAGIFTVAMYHQLHCLDEVRVAHAAVHGEPIPGRIPNATAAEICIEQLWQILQCNADSTLDPAVLVERNGTSVPGATGDGVNHRCNDWTKIRDAVERNAVH